MFNLFNKYYRNSHWICFNFQFGSIVLIVDDIMDKSNFRFGFPTWHTFNDEYEVLNYYVPALYSSLTSFISKNYETYSYYKNLSALYHKVK